MIFSSSGPLEKRDRSLCFAHAALATQRQTKGIFVESAQTFSWNKVRFAAKGEKLSLAGEGLSSVLDRV